MNEAEPSASGSDGRNSSVGLKAYLDDVAALVKRVPASWVRCELHALKVSDRFTRMEFIETDQHGRQIAKVQGGCWPAVWRRVEADFQAAGLTLEAGSQVLVKLQGDLNPTFGFQVSVKEVDLTFALGDLNARMQAIRLSLQDEGIWSGNRSLPIPTDFVRVAVIAPAGAAGLGDFRATADRLADAGLVDFTYHEVPFQSREAPARIVDALRSVYRSCADRETRPCAVCIIRGGGASADLAWLVDRKLAEAVCRMRIPVITGIGHERDRNLLDEVACIPCDTPSKAAERIRSAVVTAARDGERALEAIQSQAARFLTRHEIRTTGELAQIDRDGREVVRQAEAKVRAAATGLEPGARSLLDESAEAVAAARLVIDRRARETARLAEVGVGRTSGRLDPGARAQLDMARDGILAEMETARTISRCSAEAAGDLLRGLERTLRIQVGTAVKPLEFGAAGAHASIRTRVEALPETAADIVTRERRSIIDEAARIGRDMGEGVEKLRTRIGVDATGSLDDCSAIIASIGERAEALHPRNVLAAGYAILRGRSGEPLTNVEAVEGAGLILAELRDGTTTLREGTIMHPGEKSR